MIAIRIHRTKLVASAVVHLDFTISQPGRGRFVAKDCLALLR
jgi:hypothetical protein